MVKKVERTAIAHFTLAGQEVVPGQVVEVDRKQFSKLVAAGCIHEDSQENAEVPKLSLAGTVGTVIAESAVEQNEAAGNAAHHNGGRLETDPALSAAEALAAGAEIERRHLEAGITADAQKALEDKTRLEAEAKARAESEQRAKAEAEAKVKAEAEDKAKAEAAEKARLEAEDKAKADAPKAPGAAGPSVRTSAPQLPRSSAANG